MTILTPARPPGRAGRDQRSFLPQRAQPAMNGLIDGSLSTLAPIFAVAFATHSRTTRSSPGWPPHSAPASAWPGKSGHLMP